MKKQFFYAALAIALMSSCSKDNEPVNTTDPTPENPGVIDETKPVAIELGINAPSVTATRGTGSVGDIAGDAKNVWNKQQLKIYMFPKNSISASYVSPINTLNFLAPDGTTSSKITIADGTIPYYPMQGAFDFYGYHMDTGENNANPTANLAEGSFTVNGEIDGTNDVMAAIASVTLDDQVKLLNKLKETDTYKITTAADDTKSITNGETPLTDAEKVALAKEIEKTFSSYAARRDIQPTLTFKHLLTRLKFNVKAGEKQAAIDQYADGTDGKLPIVSEHNFPDLTALTDEQKTALENGEIVDLEPDAGGTSAGEHSAVFIQSIKVTDQQNLVSLTFTQGTAPVISAEGTITTPAVLPTYTPAFSGTDGVFTLMDRENSITKDLTPTATAELANATSVGESMMVAPKQESFKVEIIVMQYVKTKEGETSATDEYKWKLSKLTSTVKAPTIMPNPKGEGTIDSTDKDETTGNFFFATGKSYNINITVYGYQKIEISAELTGWIAGSDVEVNPEDDAFNK